MASGGSGSKQVRNSLKTFQGGKKPQVVIFANGICENPKENLQYIKPEAFIICADGGTEFALQLGLTPDLIVGDLDSISVQTLQAVQNKGIEIRRHPQAKDKTDLELALDEAIWRAEKEILVLTAFGGRVDQFLANIFLLVRYQKKGIRLSIADGKQRIRLMRGPDEMTLTGEDGDIFSFIPLSNKVTGVDLSGMEWSLQDAVLEMGSTRAVSNKLKLAPAKVKIKSGTALIIHIEK